ncbi:MAG TPA: DUF4954 family protein [Rectinemataceae bacterium]
MMNDIKVSCDIEVGIGFVPHSYLEPGQDEYSIRDAQLKTLGSDPGAYRKLSPFELETLVRNHNTCSDWSLFLVSDPFTPELVHNNAFSGLVRLGRLDRVSLEHHDLHLQAGISNSRIIACDIGDNCVIVNCSYIAHYIIGNNCILIDNAEIHASNHAKFGWGCLVKGEAEDLRIGIDVMNEAGGRTIHPFDGMNCADAYLWARHRENPALMARFKSMTDSAFDSRRGKYGTIGPASVLKSNGVIKDVAIGESAYIKGANKLKNLSINSRETARTQIGEGVEMVNGIVGYGCKIFYGCKAVRFVMCDNSSLKYGARLIHSVLGENSTVSCCEILNNLIFPAHEQHHNTSFLIASLVKGQSNMAAGATVGSNHNSRAPDGEIEAGRGFWPGLCTSLKHSSRFASFCLLAKGDYRFELDIPFPFSLIDNDYARDRLLVSPAYWWTGNMYALMRNEAKFKARDLRPDKGRAFEYSPFAPDTAAEMISAIGLLEKLVGTAAGAPDTEAAEEGKKLLQAARSSLGFEVEAPGLENSSRGCIIKKPARAWAAYREMLLWFAGNEILNRIALPRPASDAESGLARMEESARELEGRTGPGIDARWENLGGLLVWEPRVTELLSRISSGDCPSWKSVHEAYGELSALYRQDRLDYAWSVLGWLYPSPGHRGPGADGLARALGELGKLADMVGTRVLESRAKDWDNPFRKSTFRSKAEMESVLGKPEESSFVISTRQEMLRLKARVDRLLG